MNITDVRIHLETYGNMVGFASVTIDNCFVVHDIKIFQGSEGYFITMPRKRANGEYLDVVHPLNTETREMLQTAVIEAYEKAIEGKRAKHASGAAESQE